MDHPQRSSGAAAKMPDVSGSLFGPGNWDWDFCDGSGLLEDDAGGRVFICAGLFCNQPRAEQPAIAAQCGEGPYPHIVIPSISRCEPITPTDR
jgi:hypothetical protein